VTVVDLSRIISMLEVKRIELLRQLDAIDHAIAALRSAPAGDIIAEGSEDPQPAEVPNMPDPPLEPVRVKAKRVLGEAHKQALTMGRRKARQKQDAAAGHAREMPDDTFVPALAARGAEQLPRLVKKSRHPPAD
jgi:hypothetical protein